MPEQQHQRPPLLPWTSHSTGIWWWWAGTAPQENIQGWVVWKCSETRRLGLGYRAQSSRGWLLVALQMYSSTPEEYCEFHNQWSIKYKTVDSEHQGWITSTAAHPPQSKLIQSTNFHTVSHSYFSDRNVLQVSVLAICFQIKSTGFIYFLLLFLNLFLYMIVSVSLILHVISEKNFLCNIKLWTECSSTTSR